MSVERVRILTVAITDAGRVVLVDHGRGAWMDLVQLFDDNPYMHDGVLSSVAIRNGFEVRTRASADGEMLLMPLGDLTDIIDYVGRWLLDTAAAAEDREP